MHKHYYQIKTCYVTHLMIIFTEQIIADLLMKISLSLEAIWLSYIAEMTILSKCY